MLFFSYKSSIDDYTPLEKSEFSSINTIYYNDHSTKDNKPEQPLETKDDNLVENITLPQVELIHADISVQHFTVCNNVAEETEIKKSTFELTDPNNHLLEILKNIPEDYSKRIIDLIERERVEQQNEIEEERLMNQNDDKFADDESPEKLSGSVLSPSPSEFGFSYVKVF